MPAKKAFFITILLTLFLVPALAPAEEEELFDTKTAVASMEKGSKLLAAKKYDEAIEALEEAVAAAPNAEAHYLLGYAYYMKGRKEDNEDARQKAIENFDQAYQIDPNFTPSKFEPETITAPGAAQSSDEMTPAAAAPASKLEPGAAAPPAP
jgi:tetratricopeptide (TPR) repeat protein